MLIRSMSPKVIVADEIGGVDDIEIIKYAICSGCKGIFTAHGANFNDIYKYINSELPSIKKQYNFLEDETIFENIIDETKISVVANNYYSLNLTDNFIIGAGLNVYNSICYYVIYTKQ